jgi:hypothetical protein
VRRRRFESETPQLFQDEVSLEFVHTKNVTGPSVLHLAAAPRSVQEYELASNASMRLEKDEAQKVRARVRDLAFV